MSEFVGAPCPDEGGCSGYWPANFILFEVQPASTDASWSYRVTGTVQGNENDPLDLYRLPDLNHVTSGNPRVTEDFDGVAASATATHSTGYHRTDGNSILVSVDTANISGGTISALDTIFVTPEPNMAPVAGLLVIAFAARRAISASLQRQK